MKEQLRTGEEKVLNKDLFQYNKKKVRVTTTDGAVYIGKATAHLPGEKPFELEEMSIEIDQLYVSKSQIDRIEALEDDIQMIIERREKRDKLITELRNGPKKYISIFPEHDSSGDSGMWFFIDEYYREEKRQHALKEKFVNILLKINYFYDIEVSKDDLSRYEIDPHPKKLKKWVFNIPEDSLVRIMIPDCDAMIEIEAEQTNMTLYSENEELNGLIEKLVTAEGLFVQNR